METKLSKISRKLNLFFKNLIFDHFYTDDPLAEIIGREMILWQDCSHLRLDPFWISMENVAVHPLHMV
jgi:hypothetical protein